MIRAGSVRLVPVLRSLRLKSSPQGSFTRNLWDLRPTDNFRSIWREMEKMERDLLYRSPLRNIMPRFIPVEGNEVSSYRVNVDVTGFKPEEINVSVKDQVLIIRAKMERSSEDGEKYYQEVSREITLPENVKSSELKSFLNRDGVLAIEAPYESEEKPKEIPVSKNE